MQCRNDDSNADNGKAVDVQKDNDQQQDQETNGAVQKDGNGHADNNNTPPQPETDITDNDKYVGPVDTHDDDGFPFPSENPENSIANNESISRMVIPDWFPAQISAESSNSFKDSSCHVDINLFRNISRYQSDFVYRVFIRSTHKRVLLQGGQVGTLLIPA